jgi:hypothetical protein
MLSINQFVDLLKSMAQNHEQINTFGEGDIWEIGSANTFQKPSWTLQKTNSVQYPLMWVVPLAFPTARLNDGAWEAQLKYTLLFADIEQSDKSNEQEVLNDMQSVALDILTQLSDQEEIYSDSFILLPTAQFTPFTEKLDDLVAGWKVDITIRVVYLRDACAVPSTLTPAQISSGCLPVVIENSDGTFTRTFASGSNNLLADIIITDGVGVPHTVPSNKNYTVPACSGGAGGWTLVENSNNSYSAVWVSGTTLDLPDIQIKKVGGGVIATIPSVKNYTVADNQITNSDDSYTDHIHATDPYVMPDAGAQNSDRSYQVFIPPPGVLNIPDSNVHNSDNSYIDSLPATKALALPDVTITDGDGNTHVIPACKNYAVPACSGGSSIIIGTATNYGTVIDGSSDYAEATQFVCNLSANMVKFAIHSTANGNVKLGIYTNSAGLPGTLLHSVTSAVSIGDNLISFTSTALTAGTLYWLAAMGDSVGVLSSSSNASGATSFGFFVYKFLGYSNPLPSSFGTPDGSVARNLFLGGYN